MSYFFYIAHFLNTKMTIFEGRVGEYGV